MEALPGGVRRALVDAARGGASAHVTVSSTELYSPPCPLDRSDHHELVMLIKT